MKTSRKIESVIGTRLARLGLSRNVTQSMLAKDAGISLRTLGRFKAGGPSTLETFLRVVGTFQESPELLDAGIEVVPLTMVVRETPFEFPGLNGE